MQQQTICQYDVTITPDENATLEDRKKILDY